MSKVIPKLKVKDLLWKAFKMGKENKFEMEFEDWLKEVLKGK